MMYGTSLKHISKIYRPTVCTHSGVILRQHQIDDWFLQLLWYIESGVFLETKVYLTNGERENAQQNNFSSFHIFHLEMVKNIALHD